MLLEREAAGRPVTVGVIGAGKFGTMFLAQARTTRGMHVVAVADLDVGRASKQLRDAGWAQAAISAASLADACKARRTHVTPDAAALIGCPEIEVIVEATGIPAAGTRWAPSPTASTVSWSRWKPMRSRGRCSRARRRPPVWCTASPGAISRR